MGSVPKTRCVSKTRMGAVLLAAGAGRRLGGTAKALIRVQGVSLARRHLIALRDAGIDEMVMVTGFSREAVESEACGLATKLAYNAAFGQGLAGSVRVGLTALGQAFDGIIVALVDQPLIEANDLAVLVAAFENRTGGHVLVPHVEGERGNPVVIDEYVRARVLASPPGQGVRDLLDREPDLMRPWQTSSARFVTDLDTPEDLERIARLTGWRIELPAADAAQSPHPGHVID
jgi:CTP:molybdopterin cytidylyltransferase MocA